MRPLRFRQRLFLYFAVLFTVFAIGIALFERSREQALKTTALTERLDEYTQLIHTAIQQSTTQNSSQISWNNAILPPELRLSIIDLKGEVLFDNKVKQYEQLENHSQRNEVQEAIKKGKGKDIRLSESNHQTYLYYAKRYEKYIIRVALPYNIQLQQFLKADNYFLYFLLLLFLISLFFIHYITQQFGLSIQSLRNFALNVENKNIKFGQDELGEIGKKLEEQYHQLETSKKSLSLEKQKLLQHIQISEEGICFFNVEHQVEFYNGLFLQYLNQLTDADFSQATSLLQEPDFESLYQFLQKGEENYFETQIKKHAKVFSLRANVFEDKSYEVILTDITQQEKTRKVKQEMTSNIAHELRTPVTSISAYLETILNQNLPVTQQQHFLQQAYNQTQNLSHLIKDVSILSKLEEAPQAFNFEAVNLVSILEKIKTEWSAQLEQKNITFNWNLPEHLELKANPSLVLSIFQNLTENVIRYAGTDCSINVSLVNEDKDFYYFTFYDTGVGVVDETHLVRLFERFYRVDAGRTRDTGGSGLGLSIVKNAVRFHKGNITAKNRKEGGLEFFFNLHK